MSDQINHDHRPRRASWTHIALHVKDIEKTIAWYERYTHLKLLQRGQEMLGYNAWLGDSTTADNPFVLVLAQFFEGKDPFAPAQHPPMAPFAHIGIELPTKEAVDEVAARASADGCLGFGPKQMPKHVGYICMLKDPDGNNVEFSYDQGVYEKAREVWGA
ncbi:VOC family protein [Sphingomonas colocasiae]|uniref:VOC family protein n=1 Tax=Sphingomonas colocasiae TaxID=1848973 RepID=A0ABS7PSD5_9SPHN|nr:VOC family protein [Sphingomonas colocasiae]MBY8824203.1 VOC family protein [Sphingomonas colocasiae]